MDGKTRLRTPGAVGGGITKEAIPTVAFEDAFQACPMMSRRDILTSESNEPETGKNTTEFQHAMLGSCEAQGQCG